MKQRKRGRPPLTPFHTIRVGRFIRAPLEREWPVRNAASLWSRRHGVKLSVRLVETPKGRELRVYRLA